MVSGAPPYADDLKRVMIETVLAKDDAELGLEMLLRQFGEREP